MISHSLPRWSRWLLWLSLFALVAGLGASASAQKPRVLRIGYQKSSALLLAKLDGQLEKAFRERGVTVEWRELLRAGADRAGETRASAA